MRKGPEIFYQPFIDYMSNIKFSTKGSMKSAEIIGILLI